MKRRQDLDIKHIGIGVWQCVLQLIVPHDVSRYMLQSDLLQPRILRSEGKMCVGTMVLSGSFRATSFDLDGERPGD